MATYNELIKLGNEEFHRAGIEDADTDARLLLEYLTGMDRQELLLHGDEEADSLTEEEADNTDGICVKYQALLYERANHKPVQYITGMADFMGLRFHVDENVLIPRFDTEFLVEEMMREVGDGSSILDMCTGSGCILLSLMKYKNDIHGAGADISRAALDIARQNEELIFSTQGIKSPQHISLHNYNKEHKPVDWILSDMFENITGKYDYIVSNPPYIQSEVIPTLMPEVRAHEPRIALDGDMDGMKYYRIIAREAAKHLNRHGKLFLEIGYDEAEAVTKLLAEHEYKDIKILKDYSGNDRMAICTT
ncbi:MAG: peptide chain release factor N(5)-glutamine methyltransferase [Lachnospiraceae bacterium]|nr:peptide chain release factor N(5)-glutamine methyltransferase [Lachnospiraceae bacterium]